MDETFFEKQGYTVSKNIIYWDNQVAIKLEMHGKNSSGKEHYILIENSFS
jgi:hypothetical protein